MTTTLDPAALDRLAADAWDAYLEIDPLFATSLGDHRFDALVPGVTPEEAADARRRFAALLERLDGLGDPPPGEAQITASSLREVLASKLIDLDSGMQDWTVNPLDGLPTLYLDVPAYQPLASPTDGEAMVARWRAMADATRRHAATLRASALDGRVACAAPVARIVAILDGVLATPDDDWPLLEPLASLATLDGWTTADRERLAATLREVVAHEVRPSFAELRATLADEILPVARPPERAGIANVPGGEDTYRGLVRAHTSLDLDPVAVHELGLAEIERIDAELTALTGRVLGTKTLVDGLARLRDDPALGFATADEVFARAEASLARANEAVPAWFGRLPRAGCEVIRMLPHEEGHSTIAYYRQPALDGSRPGQYWINTSEPRTRPRYEAEVLAFHESVPGHHLQIAIAQELDGLPAFRRNLGTTAFVEGWGLYTERLADEMGLYSGDLDRIGVLSFDAWRASRLVVDTGLHALGWPRDRAVRFMLDHTALAANNVENEVDRYIVWPGQALAYKLGQLELLRLRSDVRARLGTAFDIRAFHDAVLANGALALPTLRQAVEAWAAARFALG